MSAQHRYLFAALVLLLCGACSVVPSAVTTPGTANPSLSTGASDVLAALGTPGRCYVGAFVDDSTVMGDTANISSVLDLQQFETLAAKGVAISQMYQAFCMGTTELGFPTDNANAARSYGAVPMLTLEPWDLAATGNSLLNAIVAGSYDGTLASFANGLKAYGDPVLLRFGHEMNGNWYPWSGAANNQSAARYVEAYRYVHSYMASAGVSNVLWVFCPNAESVPSATWNEAQDYYPGDSYVDIVGVDGYNFGGGAERTFTQTFAAFHSIYQAQWSIKPLVIAELGASELAADKPSWISDAYAQLQSTFTDVRAVMWFHNDDGPATDFRINSDAAAQSAFRAAVSPVYFLSRF